MRLLQITLLALVICAVAFCETALDNATILKLVKAGIGEDTIVGMVNQQEGRYAPSADDIIALKNAGVSDKVLSAMIVKTGGGPTPPVPAVTSRSTPAPPSPPPTQPAHVNDGITRVYISDSQSWEIRGGWAAGGHTNSDGSGSWGGAGHTAGGARPQTAEIIKTFNQRCPSVTITNNSARADFAVILDHEGGKGYARRRNKIVVFNRDGDDIFSDSTRAVGSSVKDACQAIINHTPPQQSSAAAALDTPSAGVVANSFGPPPIVPLPFVLAAKTPASSQASAPPQDRRVLPLASASQKGASAQISSASTPTPQAAETLRPKPPEPDPKFELTITSDPAGAAVEINGVTVGTTPATVSFVPGTTCSLTVKKDGFVPWKITNYPTSAAGKFNLNANLTKEVFH